MIHRSKKYRIHVQIRRGGGRLSLFGGLLIGTGLVATIAMLFLLLTLGFAMIMSSIPILLAVLIYRSALRPSRAAADRSARLPSSHHQPALPDSRGTKERTVQLIEKKAETPSKKDN